MNPLSQAVALSSIGLSLVGALLLFRARDRQRGTLYLAGSLVIAAVASLLRYFFLVQSAVAVVLPLLAFPLLFWAAPFALGYVRATFGLPFPRPWAYGALALSLAGVAAHALLLAFVPHARDVRAVSDQVEPLRSYTICYFLALSVWSLFCLVGAWSAIASGRRQYEQEFSGASHEQASWLRFYVAVLALIVSVPGVLAIANQILGPRAYGPVTPVEGLLMLALIYAVLQRLVEQPDLFRAVPSRAVPAAVEAGPRLYAKQAVQPDDRRALLAILDGFMRSQRPFLDEGLSLRSLAGRLQVPVHHLSMTINAELRVNFHTYVNAFRVAEAARLLRDASQSDRTILDIAYESGFQSKAAFNRLFRLLVGTSPKEFRRSSLPPPEAPDLLGKGAMGPEPTSLIARRVDSRSS